MENFKINLIILIKLIGFSLLVLSCATKKDRDFQDFDSQEIEGGLGIDQKTLEKFRVKKVDTVERLSKRKTKSPKKRPKSEKKITPSKAPIKVSGPSTKKESVPIMKPLIQNDDYPADYPENLKGYDQKSKLVWPQFKPFVIPGEKYTFRVGYLGITAGFIKIETLPRVNIGGTDAFHFKARMRSARYYSYIYTLDDSLESYVSADQFIPLKYVLLQRESAQTVDDLQLFDSQKLKTYHFYKRLKKGKRKNVELEKPIPRYFQDSFSALFFVRGLPLNKGDLYEFPIVTRGKIWILKIKVEGIESLKVKDKWVDAIRINAETRFPGVLEKKGDIRFWYSSDKSRRLLKFQADVKIGSIKGDLVEYQSK